MADVLLVPPGSITAADRDLLREVGVVVVETDDASKCQFLKATEAISSSDMLWAAMDALRRDFGYGKEGKEQRQQLAQNLWTLIAAEFEDRRPELVKRPAATEGGSDA